MGMERIKQHLAEFHYGNQDMSGGLTNAWLHSSLKISPEQQIELLKAAWHHRLPISTSAIEFTQSILPSENFLDGTLSGKTGSSGFYSENVTDPESHFGLYIGYFIKNSRTYAVS